MSYATNFTGEYYAIPWYISPSIALALGTYRIYVNPSSTTITASALGIKNIIAIDCITSVSFSSINDLLVPFGEDIKSYGGDSINSDYMVGQTFPAGKLLQGNYDYVKLSSGTAILYAISEQAVNTVIPEIYYAVDELGNQYVDPSGIYDYII